MYTLDFLLLIFKSFLLANIAPKRFIFIGSMGRQVVERRPGIFICLPVSLVFVLVHSFRKIIRLFRERYRGVWSTATVNRSLDIRRVRFFEKDIGMRDS